MCSTNERLIPEPLDVDTVPSEKWLKSFGCAPMTREIIHGAGLTWRHLSHIEASMFEPVATDHRLEPLLALTRLLIEVDDEVNAENRRADILEYFLLNTDVLTDFSTVLDSVAGVLRNMTMLRHASNPVSRVTTGRMAKEIFRRAVHIFIRV